ncbi:unnamed protein product [Effrenium voratum]|nr:unnamed protein product [Effrenium voratum]
MLESAHVYSPCHRHALCNTHESGNPSQAIPAQIDLAHSRAMADALRFAWNKKSAGAAPRPPLAKPSGGLTIAQEAAANAGELPDEEKQRKRLEAWKKVQGAKDAGEKPSEIEEKMGKVQAALKEVNQRNRDLGVRKKKKRKRSSSSSSDVMITSTDNTDLIITRADTQQPARRRVPIAAGGPIQLDEEVAASPEQEKVKEAAEAAPPGEDEDGMTFLCPQLPTLEERVESDCLGRYAVLLTSPGVASLPPKLQCTLVELFRAQENFFDYWEDFDAITATGTDFPKNITKAEAFVDHARDLHLHKVDLQASALETLRQKNDQLSESCAVRRTELQRVVQELERTLGLLMQHW